MKAFSGWRFGAFELDETNRRLRRNKQLIPLQPKAFDTLTILLRKAGQLVGRKELFEAVWPDAEVEDANLTNNIATLRKILGTASIKAVPKFGYRFCLPVVEVRLLADEACAALQEGQARMVLRTVQSVQEARNLFWLAIAHQSDYATAWAWLGRASRFLEKFGVERTYHRELGIVSFRQAFAIDPDCGAAHQFYTTLQTDRGEGLDALSRLLHRARKHPEDAHNFAALVQVCRFCGLLTASEQAHKRALELDRSITTSLAHTYFARCDYHAVIEAYVEAAKGARNYLDVSAWACLGFKERTEAEIERRLSSGTTLPIFEALLRSLLFALRGNASEVKRICLSQDLYEDAETSLYLARHLTFSGCIESGLTFLKQAIEGGLAIPEMLRRDEWLRPLRTTAQFESLLKQAVAIQREGERRLAAANIAQLRQ